MDYKNIFEDSFSLLKVVGLKLVYQKSLKGWLFKILAIYVLIMVLLQAITTIFYVKTNISNVLVFTDTAAPSLSGFCLALKLLGYYFLLGTVRNVTYHLRKITSEIEDETEQSYINSGLRQCRTIKIVYGTCALLTAATVVTNSLYENFTSTNRGFSLNSFKLDFLSFLRVSPIFEFAWVVIAALAFQISIGFIGSVTLYCTMGLNLAAHLRILRRRIEKTDFETKDFLEIIKYHKVVIKNCKEFNRIFDMASFTQMCLGIALSCFLIFLLLTVRLISNQIIKTNFSISFLQTNDTQLKSKCVVYLATVYTELLMYEYIGSEISTEVGSIYS